MTTHELELLNMIREHRNPEVALATALDIILLYLEQSEEQDNSYLEDAM